MENTSQPASSRRRILLICLALAAVTLLAYARVYRFDFFNFDDPAHLTGNPHIREGLSREGIVWAFTTFTQANWFPITWLSHLAVYEVFGFHAGAHHVVNVAIHVLASLALFGFLLSATGARGPSAFVAAVFALHPMHVESVAWVTERKDVLCALFWFLALRAWVRDSARQGLGRYFDTLICFILGIMSKPMIVTFPLTLLLVDLWPLRRPISRKWLWEKWPFFLLSAASAVVTWVAQRSGGAVMSLREYPLSLRVENALLTVWIYAGKTFWPARLALAYSWPRHPAIWLPVAAALGIAAVSVFVVRSSGRRYLLFGWFWFLFTLIPVIGLVQVGSQARADRYMYVPMVGLAVMVAWGVPDIIDTRPELLRILPPLAVAVCAGMAALTFVQTGHWRTAEGMFRYAVSLDPENDLAYTYLGSQLAPRPESRPAAIAAYEAALRLDPTVATYHANLANVYGVMGRTAEAISEYGQALRLDPDDEGAHLGLGRVLEKIPGRLPDALEQFHIALRLDPEDEDALLHIASSLLSSGRTSEAIPILERMIKIDPDNPIAHMLLGTALMKIPGRSEEALDRLETAVSIAPGFSLAQNNLGIALQAAGRPSLALDHFEQAVRSDPKNADARHNLGIALLQAPGRRDEAIGHLEQALQLAPDPVLRRQLDELERKPPP